MIRHTIALFMFCAIAAAGYSEFFPNSASSTHAQNIVLKESNRTVGKNASSSSQRVKYLKSNQHGHFIGNFKLNGRATTGLIDTGATYIALNEQTARKIGLTPPNSAYTYKINTANGVVTAAHVQLKNVEIGRVKAINVDAFVLKGESLQSTLIGMSFLKKLKKYSVSSGTLTMVQ